MFQFRRFPTYAYFVQRRLTEYCSAGFPHSEIRGYNAYVQLPTAYRSLSRPSSALDAKAFPLRSFQLDLLALTHLSQSRDIGSHKNYAGLRFGFIVVCVTLILKVHKKLCYLSVACSQFLACFTVQFSRCSSNLFQGQIEMLILLDKHFNLPSKEVVGPSGLEPPTSRLSVVRSSQLSYGPVWWRLPDSNR